MRRSVVIGATGQTGRAAVSALARGGWEVTAASTRREACPAMFRAYGELFDYAAEDAWLAS
jgi:uncharacterized protein YbjT (DUF2867 family)